MTEENYTSVLLAFVRREFMADSGDQALTECFEIEFLAPGEVEHVSFDPLPRWQSLQKRAQSNQHHAS